MLRSSTRRTFLRQGATAGALCGLGDLGFLARLAPVSAAEAQLDRRPVELHAQCERPLIGHRPSQLLQQSAELRRQPELRDETREVPLDRERW